MLKVRGSKMVVPELGHIPGVIQNLYISSTALNQHLLITGKSGSGKTIALKKIEEGIALQGGCVLVLNFNGTHDSLCEKSYVKFINARTDGIPLPLFSPIIRPDGREEEADDICEAVVDVFSNVRRLGSSQKRTLSRACHNAIEARAYYDDDMKGLYASLEACEGDGGQALIDTFGMLMKKAKFIKDGKLWEDGGITVLDFSEFNVSYQILLAELVMSILWRHHRIYGQQTKEPVWIVCDEFQSLNLKGDSVLTQILREGRKFNLSLLLATQTLSIFDTGCRALLQQSATKLYFRPSESDIKKVSKDILGIQREKVQQMLHKLAVGECLAEGEFLIGTHIVENVFNMSFR